MTDAPAVAGTAVVEPAPSKINLYLHVTGRRADGYHELDSWVAFASIGDTVAVRPHDRPSLSVEGPFAGDVPDSDDNLVLRAMNGLADALDRRADAAIHLTKRLPVASGIGGGSADAAAVLRALVRLWGVSPDPTLLAEIATRIGADVPVCLRSDSAFMGGIGEQLAPAPAVTGCPVVLANPKVPVPTASVFRARAGAFSPADRPQAVPDGPRMLAELLGRRRNDLSPAAKRLYPAVGAVESALADLPGCLFARMSGSGGTCFGLFETAEAAEEGGGDLAARHPGWWVRPGCLL